MTTYFEAPDGHGESTVWARNPDRPDHPVAIIRSHDVHTHYWPDVVARMTGTIVVNDDATMERISDALSAHYNEERALFDDGARAILAALTWVPHD